jgi:amidase
MRDDEICRLGISELRGRFEDGALSVEDVTEACLHRIEALDSALHAYSVVWDERARASAQRLDALRRRSSENESQPLPPLYGVPIAVKDLCDVAGEPTRAGTTVLGSTPATANATVVDRLDAAGAVLIGKTTMTEGAFISHHPSVTPPVNPWHPDRWTGISSSGSGVAVAAGLCRVALGTDTGGSIRFPSAACGLTGLKPTHGRVSLRGVFPLSGSLDHIGPMGRSVDDVARVFSVLAGFDAGDPWSRPDLPAVGAPSALSPHVKGMRLGFDRAYGREGVEPSILAAIEEAMERYRSLGAEIVDWEMPPMDEVIGAWVSLCAVEAADAHAATYPEHADDYGDQLRATLELGRKLDGATVANAWRNRVAFSRRLEGALGAVDAMIAPVTPDLFAASTNLGDVEATPAVAGAVRFTAPFNVSGVPSLTLPGGFDRDGAPIGFQLVASSGQETRLLALGSAYQAATDWHSRHPDLDRFR